MRNAVDPLPNIKSILDKLSVSRAVSERLEAVRTLGGLDESGEVIVRALLDARDSDPDPEVRAEAARALRSTVHQAVLRQTIALALRAEPPAELPTGISFEAWETTPETSAPPDRWIVELSAEEAVFLQEGTGERIVLALTEASAAIQPVEGSPAEALQSGFSSTRRYIQVRDHTLGLSPTAHMKLMEWLDRIPAAAPAGKARRAIPRSAWILLGLGIVQLAFPGTLSPFWGGAWVLLGAANIAAPPRRLDLLNALVVMLAGMWYILFAGPGLSLLGYGPGIWGTLRLVEYARNR